MKLTQFFAAAIIIMGFEACNMDFSNACDDKWVVTNKSAQAINITFSDKTNTPETIAAATLNGTAITPATALFYHKADAGITIADTYHVDWTASYSYSENPARRTLVITDQTKYKYEITNNSASDVTFTLNTKTYSNTLTGGTAAKEEIVKQYEIAKNTGTTGEFIIYKNKPSFTFYIKDSKTTVAYTTTTDTNGKTYITIK